jgi:hypothetical protein
VRSNITGVVFIELAFDKGNAKYYEGESKKFLFSAAEIRSSPDRLIRLLVSVSASLYNMIIYLTGYTLQFLQIDSGYTTTEAI